MKKANKSKNVQPPKGNLKISSFFQKQPLKVQTLSSSGDNKPGTTKVDVTFSNETATTSNPLVIDSDSEGSVILPRHKRKYRKCGISTEHKSVKIQSDDEFQNHKPSCLGMGQTFRVESARCECQSTHCTNCPKSSHKRRKTDSPEKGISKSEEKVTCNVVENVKIACSSENGVLSRVTVKTPEKLFSSQFLKQNMSSGLDQSRSTELSENQTSITPLKSCDTNISKENIRRAPSKTPSKSPKLKLFHNTPKKLEEFNVEVLEKFVKITPSKSNHKIDSEKVNNIKTPSSSAKKQVSILKYMSPSPSSSREAQIHNETTPQRKTPSRLEVTPRSSKIKMKLDFSDDVNKFVISKAEPSTSNNKENINAVSQSVLENFGNLLEDDWDTTFNTQSFNDLTSDLTLNLTDSKHCEVLEAIHMRNRISVKIQSTSTKERAVCYLEDFWISTRLKVGDIIHLSAVKSDDGNWIINNKSGLLVFEPDLLISSTSVVGSLFCMRRAVLSEHYQHFEPTNHIMLIGTLIHMLLQNVLKYKFYKRTAIEKCMEDLISSKSTMRRMYEASVSSEELRRELMEFVPRIVTFIGQYVKNDNCHTEIRTENKQHKPWIGKIESIDDIEENIWCTQLGIKGKVDLSICSKNQILPLELKTGKTSMSLEHKGQVILYVMMMNKLGHKITSGLLLYLKEGLLSEVDVTQQESRDIIILRNDLAYYLSKQPTFSNNAENTTEDTNRGNNLKKQLHFPELPEPISHLNGCKRCPYNVICSSHILYENHDISSKKDYLTIQKQSITHLQKNHLDYFIHWSSLLLLEHSAHKDRKTIREIYTIPAKERVKNGRCISDVALANVEVKTDSILEHTFMRSDENCLINFLASGILENNYVVISTENRPAIISGFVTEITTTSITVSLDKNLENKYANAIFNLDTYDSLTSSSFNMTSLALLLEDTARSEHLRRIIIDKEKPRFLPKLPKIVATKSVPILRRLNKIQQRAILKSISARDFLLIKGMPGTGKTSTIVALIQLLVELGKTVLITSHTHSAVDNVCLRLQTFGISVLRLGAIGRVDENMKLCSEFILTKDCKTPEEIEKIYNAASVVAVTCLGSGHPLLSKRTFDVAIVDESTQVLQTSVLRALYCAKTFILIGDPDQLAPVIKNHEAIKQGMSESLFERLCDPETCVSLNLNYRMNKTITAIANAVTYNGELLVGNEAVGNTCLMLPKELWFKAKFKDHTWILKCLETNLESSVQIIDTNLNDNVLALGKTMHTSQDTGCVNIFEASIIVKLVKTLLEVGVPGQDIGVIATYRAQVAYISTVLKGVDVNTVDQFQGKDKSVIFYSCTKYKNSNLPKSEFELLQDQRRLTVAITRAKHKLVIVGDLKVIREFQPVAKLLRAVDESRIFKVEDGTCDFTWEYVLNEVCSNQES